MTPEPFPHPPTAPARSARPRSFVCVLAAMAYVVAVAGLRVLAYRCHFNEVFLTPVAAEFLLIPTLRPRRSYALGWAWRVVGLALGNYLAHRVYLMPAIYGDHEPWPDEFDALWLGILLQAAVVTLPFWLHRRLRR